jgi:hypothetical protein
MGADTKADLEAIKSTIRAIKTVKKQKAEIKARKKKNLSQKTDKAKKLTVDTIKNFDKVLKSRTKSLFEELIELFVQTNETIDESIKKQKESFEKKFNKKIPKKGKRKQEKQEQKVDEDKPNVALLKIQNSSTFRNLGKIFFTAIENTKAKISQLLIEDIISTIGCSEEQSYSNLSQTSTPVYVNLKTIDLFNILKQSPEDELGSLKYEKSETQNGEIPYSMNRQLYRRLSSPQSFSQEYGLSFKGISGQELFDIQYVDNYINQNGNTFYGDYFKVTLKNQANNRNNISDFLNDYYSSIDVFNLDGLIITILGQIFGAFNVGISPEETKELSKFNKIVTRFLGLCNDPTQKIDITGTGKLSDGDLIDDSFFELTASEEVELEETVNRIINGLATFEDCETLNLPVNVPAVKSVANDVIKENKATAKINKFFNGIDDLTSDPNWGQPQGLNINLSIEFDILAKLPLSLFITILSPKVMLGFMIMVKSLSTNLTDFLDLNEFLKKYKKFIAKFTRNIIGLFLEELTNEIKKNLKKLVQSLLKDIKDELLDKRTKMYVTIAQALLIIGTGIVDYRQCKSVIDDILRLINLIVN